MPGTVYRTTHYSHEQVQHLKTNANRQEKILARAYFHCHPEGYTATEAHNKIRPNWPKSSTRRAITTLAGDGILEKTTDTRDGEYGRPEHVYKWKAPQPRQTALFQPKHKGAYSQ